MRKRALIIAAAVIVVAVVAFAVWPREREPEYQGKKLSEWLDGCMPGASPARGYAGIVVGAVRADEETSNAVRQIGTNGLPFLIRWIESSTGEHYLERAQLVGRLPPRIQKIAFIARWAAPPANFRGPLGFMILAEQGGPAVPRLTGILWSAPPSREDVAAYAAASLGYVGMEGLRALIRAAEDRRLPGNRRAAVIDVLGRLGYLGPEAASVVPVLGRCMQDEDRFVSNAACDALGMLAQGMLLRRIGGAPGSRPPRDPELRILAVRELGRFRENEMAGARLTNSLWDRNLSIRNEAAQALGISVDEANKVVLRRGGFLIFSEQ